MDDYFTRLCDAIDRLSHIIKEAGPDSELGVIVLKGSRRGIYDVRRAAFSSPSFNSVSMGLQSNIDNTSFEVLGIKITGGMPL